MTLKEAIAAEEAAESKLASADADQAVAQSAFDAAKARKDAMDAADQAAGVDYEASLDELIVAATAAKKKTPVAPTP